MGTRALAYLTLGVVLGACSGGAPKVVVTPGAIVLRTNDFEQGGVMPSKFTCDGANVSPALRWTNPPPGTKSFDLSMIDLDAGDFIHWRVDGIPADVNATEEGQDPPGQVQRNGFGKDGYGGPCPPSGSHRYRFEIQAFSDAGGAGKPLGSGSLDVTYRRTP